MGDDAEMYIESGGDPTTLIPDYYWDDYYKPKKAKKKSVLQNNAGKKSATKKAVNKTKITKQTKAISKQSNKTKAKKENTALFIDGENISHKKAEIIKKVAEKQGVIHSSRVYGIQKDNHTQGWTDKAKESGIKDIRLCGDPEKDKVDKKIQKDAKREIVSEKSVDIVCLATSDTGYVDTIKELRSKGKKVVVIGEKKASDELRKSCNEFIEI